MFTYHGNTEPKRRSNPHPDPESQRHESYLTDLQARIDRERLTAFEAGRLLIQNPKTSDFFKPDRIFVPSLSELVEVVDLETGVRSSEIRGGWVQNENNIHKYNPDITTTPDVAVAA